MSGSGAMGLEGLDPVKDQPLQHRSGHAGPRPSHVGTNQHIALCGIRGSGFASFGIIGSQLTDDAVGHESWQF
jgi:hypothetical protein